MLNNPFIIGLVGEKGSGKGTFAKLLQKIAPKDSLSYLCFSDILVETLNLWLLPLTRANYQNLANTMEKSFGSGTLARTTKNRIKKLQGNIIVDGIRRWPEEKLIRSFPNNLIIYITADPKIRYRNLKSKSDKTNETKISFEKFMKEETDDAEILIPEIGQTADLKIVNNGTLEEYKKDVEKVYINEILRLSGFA